ncbi:MAG: hypothetical protein ABIL36_08300 [candidate division WOR-3 bacterium]
MMEKDHDITRQPGGGDMEKYEGKTEKENGENMPSNEFPQNDSIVFDEGHECICNPYPSNYHFPTKEDDIIIYEPIVIPGPNPFASYNLEDLQMEIEIKIMKVLRNAKKQYDDWITGWFNSTENGLVPVLAKCDENSIIFILYNRDQEAAKELIKKLGYSTKDANKTYFSDSYGKYYVMFEIDLEKHVEKQKNKKSKKSKKGK